MQQTYALTLVIEDRDNDVRDASKIRLWVETLLAERVTVVSVEAAEVSASTTDDYDQLIRDVVPTMPSEGFDSHALILKIARAFQRQYVALLHASQSQTPFQDVHGRIGRRLKALAGDLGLSEGEQAFTPDIFGNTNSCIAYTRLQG